MPRAVKWCAQWVAGILGKIFEDGAAALSLAFVASAEAYKTKSIYYRTNYYKLPTLQVVWGRDKKEWRALTNIDEAKQIKPKAEGG